MQPSQAGTNLSDARITQFVFAYYFIIIIIIITAAAVASTITINISNNNIITITVIGVFFISYLQTSTHYVYVFSYNLLLLTIFQLLSFFLIHHHLLFSVSVSHALALAHSPEFDRIAAKNHRKKTQDCTDKLDAIARLFAVTQLPYDNVYLIRSREQSRTSLALYLCSDCVVRVI